MCRYRGQWSDMCAHEPKLALAHQDVGVAELDPAGADCLHLPAFEGQAGLVALLYEVVVESLAILCNGHEREPGRAVIVAAVRAAP